MNSELVDELKAKKSEWVIQQQKAVAAKRKAGEKISDEDLVPLLHGLGFEQKTVRNYPFGDYLAHVLGFMDKT